MVSKSQYGEREVNACKAVMLELAHILGEIRDEIVIIGGWTPALLFPEADDPHVGSLDIDVAMDFQKIGDDTYQTILEAFSKHGYAQDKEHPFRFFRKVEGGFHRGAFQSDAFQVPISVEVDLLAGEYGGSGKRHRTQKIQDVRARKARGCDLAFDTSVTVTIEGQLPDGGRDKATLRVAGIVPFLVMKGMALHDRMKEKDAYDIFYCVDHYPGGVEALATEFRPLIANKLVIEGLKKIRDKFASVEHIGPKWVADFLEISETEDRDIIMRRAYEKVAALLDVLGIAARD